MKPTLATIETRVRALESSLPSRELSALSDTDLLQYQEAVTILGKDKITDEESEKLVAFFDGPLPPPEAKARFFELVEVAHQRKASAP